MLVNSCVYSQRRSGRLYWLVGKKRKAYSLGMKNLGWCSHHACTVKPRAPLVDVRMRYEVLLGSLHEFQSVIARKGLPTGGATEFTDGKDD